MSHSLGVCVCVCAMSNPSINLVHPLNLAPMCGARKLCTDSLYGNNKPYP